MLIYCELLLLLALPALFCRARPRAFRRLCRGFARLARHRTLSVILVGLLALGGSAGLALVTGWPQPHYTDEFSLSHGHQPTHATAPVAIKSACPSIQLRRAVGPRRPLVLVHLDQHLGGVVRNRRCHQR
jgi:hypothetical protein